MMNDACMSDSYALEMLEHHNPPPLKKSRPEIVDVLWVERLNEEVVHCV